MKYYLREDRKLVIPEVTNRRENEGLRYVTQDRFDLHINSLPPVEGIFAEGFETGWLEGYEEEFEIENFLGKGAMPGWYRVSITEYYAYSELNRRVILVPKKPEEKSEGNIKDKIRQEAEKRYPESQGAGYGSHHIFIEGAEWLLNILNYKP